MMRFIGNLYYSSFVKGNISAKLLVKVIDIITFNRNFCQDMYYRWIEESHLTKIKESSDL